MKNRDRGRIFLEAASKEEVRQRLHAYLCGLFKEVPRESMADLYRKTPAVLIENVPFSKVKTIWGTALTTFWHRYFPNSPPSFDDRMGNILGEEGIISLTDGRGSPKIANNETDPVFIGSRIEHCFVLWMAGGTRVFFVRPLDFHFTG